MWLTSYFCKGWQTENVAHTTSTQIEPTEDSVEEDCKYTTSLYNGSKVTCSPTCIMPDCKWNMCAVCVHNMYTLSANHSVSHYYDRCSFNSYKNLVIIILWDYNPGFANKETSI